MSRSDEEERKLQIEEGNIVPRTPPKLPPRSVSSSGTTAPPPPLPPRVLTPRNTVDLSKLPITWTYQNAGSYGESLGKTVGRATKWVAHRNPLRKSHISEINEANDNEKIRIEFTQNIKNYTKGQSIKLNDKNRVIEFIMNNFKDIISGGGKRRKRKSHRRKSHRRKSHKRKRTRRRH